jgi:hypothetical protein
MRPLQPLRWLCCKRNWTQQCGPQGQQMDGNSSFLLVLHVLLTAGRVQDQGGKGCTSREGNDPETTTRTAAALAAGGNRCGMGNARGCRGSRRKSAPRGEPALSKLQHIECRGVSTLCTPVVAAVAQRLRQDSKAVFGDAKKKACAPSACRPVDDSIDWVRRTCLYRWQAPYATT